MLKCLISTLPLILLIHAVAWGQTDTAKPPEKAPSTNPFSAATQLIESASDLDATSKSMALDAYRQAGAAVEAMESYQAKAKAFQEQSAGIEKQLDDAKEALSKPVDTDDANTDDDMSLNDLDATVQQKAAAVETAKQDLATRSAAIDAKEKRLVEIPRLISTATRLLTEIDTQLSATSPTGKDARVAAANSALLEARKKALQSELDALKLESLWLVANDALLQLQRDAAKRLFENANSELASWDEAAQKKRKAEVKKYITKAETAAASSPESLRKLAASNVKTAAARKDTEDKLDLASKREERLQSILAKLEEQFTRAQSEASSKSAVTQLLGEALRTRRSELNEYEAELLSSRELESRAAEVRVQKFLITESKSDLQDLAAATQARVAEYNVPSGDIPALKKQLDFRKELLDGLFTDTDALFQTLVRVERTQSSLKALTERYGTFIDERVLWIRSTGAFGPKQFSQSFTTLQNFSQPAEWKGFWIRLLEGLKARPLPPLVAALILIPLLIFNNRLRSRLRDCGESAESGSCRDFGLTLRSIVLTVGIAFIWPAVLYIFGTWLRRSVSPETDVIGPLSAACIAMAAALLPLELWRQSARAHGLMHSHFGVAPRVCQLTRANLRWLIYLLIPVIGLTAAIRSTASPEYYQSLGRVSFAISMGVIAYFVFRLAHPTTGAPRGYLARRGASSLFKTRFVWFWLLVSIPIMLLVLSLVGYQFTADQLGGRCFWTAFSLLAVWFFQAIVLRWTVVSRRRLAIEQARARLAKASQQTDTGPGTPEAMADIEAIDLQSVDMQTRRLVRAITFVAGAIVLWSLWVDVLPALSRFDDIRAWDVEVASMVDAGDASGGAPNASLTLKMVSYADVFVAILIFVAMLLAMRDLPGLLELVLLQRLPLDVALRFAITTLTRYVIFVVGTIWALSRIEIGWSQVQWLVAGVSVGLGFGLQDIFANFVSGLIILFERPLRSGDIVTIDGVTGVVKSIRLRSTIIQDWDRKSLIVPNKDFITGRLLNWTLSDDFSRIVIHVGVAYGSDIDQAKALLLSAATEHELIAREPAASVTFEEFGDSSLNLVLRCFITLQNMPSRLKIVDDLHSIIDQKYRDAGVEIPFPQQDLHVRDVPQALSRKTSTTGD